MVVVLVREEMFVAVEVPQPAAPEAVGSAAVDVRTADGQRGGGGVDLGVAAERPHDPACRAAAVAAATFPGRQQLTHSYQSWSLFPRAISYLYTGRSDVTASTVTIRSPFCG